MGELYCARDTRPDRAVDIKVLPDHLAVDPERQERYKREARIDRKSHPRGFELV
jgi:hypothetical protein